MLPHSVYIGLIIALFLRLAQCQWLKMYEETKHRPTYYNRAHNSLNHVDYNREKMADRDLTTKRPRKIIDEFDPKTHKTFYVNILHKGSVMCAGALISRRMVITSSRCFLGTHEDPTHEFKARDMSVLTAQDFGKDRSKQSRVIAFFMPTGKEEGKQDVHDIALLALERKLQRHVYRYIKLYNRLPDAGSSVTMAYVDHLSHDLTLYDSSILELKRCQRSWLESAKIEIPFDKDFFCVRNRKKAGCSTRPGDPLLIDNKLAAINIYGEHCDELEGDKLADIYYGMRHAVPFIQQATDLLRAFTGSGQFNDSWTTRRTQLIQPSTVSTII